MTRTEHFPVSSHSASCLVTVPGNVSSTQPVRCVGVSYDSVIPEATGQERTGNKLQPRSRRERAGRRGDFDRRSRERARASKPRHGAVVWQCVLGGWGEGLAHHHTGVESVERSGDTAWALPECLRGPSRGRTPRASLQDGFTACPSGQLRQGTGRVADEVGSGCGVG